MTLIMMAEGGADRCEMEMFSPPRGGNAALNDLVSHLAQVSYSKIRDSDALICCPSEFENVNTVLSFSRSDLRGILDAAARDCGRPRRLQPAARLRRLSALGRRRRRRRRAGTKRRCHLVSITTNRDPLLHDFIDDFPDCPSVRDHVLMTSTKC